MILIHVPRLLVFLPAVVGQLVAARLMVISGGDPSSKVFLSNTSFPLTEVRAVSMGAV